MLAKISLKAIIEWLAHYRLLGLAVVGVSFVIATIIVLTGPQAEPQARVEKAWPVSVLVAEPDRKQPVLVAFGKVESRQVANLRTSITAPVAEVVAREGSWVTKGDLLVRLDDKEMKLALTVATAEYTRRIAQLESARTDYDLAKRVTTHHTELKDIAEAKLKRHVDLYNTKMVSDAILDEVRREASERAIRLERHLADLRIFPNVIQQRDASVAEGRAMMEKAELDLQQTEMIAPFHGRVISTFVAPGDRVLPGSTVIQVADFDELEVRASIPAAIGYTLRQQFQNGVSVPAKGELDGRVIAFSLTRLSANVKSGQSGLDAFFKTASDESLDIGRVVNLNITLPSEENVIALPVQSIYENDRIYLVENDRLKSIEIEQVGDFVDEEGKYQILVRSDDIAHGDRVITTQLPRAITGLLVEAIDASRFAETLAAKGVPDSDTITQ